MRLSNFKVLTFDVYGTLIDWETGMIEALAPLTSQVNRSLTRNELLEAHAYHESSTQAQTPAKLYGNLLAVVYKRLAEEWGVPVSWDDCLAYGRSIQYWPAFADSARALQYFKRHYKLVVLSNVDNASFAYNNKKLGVDFDAPYTAEDIGSYKRTLPPRRPRLRREWRARREAVSGLIDLIHEADDHRQFPDTLQNPPKNRLWGQTHSSIRVQEGEADRWWDRCDQAMDRVRISPAPRRNRYARNGARAEAAGREQL